jgi:hypothetical protein
MSPHPRREIGVKEVEQMKRIFTAAAMASLLAVLVPGMASAAQRGRSRTHAHHASTHHRHVRHLQIIRFGSVAALPSAGAPAGSRTTGSPSSAPRSDGPPATPGTPAPSAGTVLSFTGGVLTITLADGSTVSGKVTEATELQCQSATPPTGTEDGGDEGSGSEGEGSGGSTEGTPPATHVRGETRSSGEGEGGQDGEEGDHGEESPACTTAALVPGAVVAEAELSVGSSGAVWDHVDLIV